MKRILKEPLVHFLLIGMSLFALSWLSGPAYQAQSRTVVVDEEALLTFMQYRAKAFNAAHFEQQLAGLSPEELQLLIDDYVREEVLYREARALQLDGEDYVVRRRLIQRLEFITKGFADASGRPDDEYVRRYFEENKSDYYIEPHVTFTHVYYDRERRGSDDAARLAQQKLGELNRLNVAFAQAPAHGDRFLYHTNYVERVPAHVASHFGKEMAAAIFRLDSGEEWYGPFESPYGFHLVLVTAREEGHYPLIEEILDRVTEDARQSQIREKTDEAIAAIIAGYDVRVAYEIEPVTEAAAR